MTKDDLEAAVFGAGGIAAGGAPGKLLVDHSTTEVGVTKAFAERLRAEAGMGWVDAPVSGGPPAAAAGTLALMAGGARPTSPARSRCWPISASARGWARSAPGRPPRWSTRCWC